MNKVTNRKSKAQSGTELDIAIEVRELRKTYNKVQALDGLTLSVKAGTIFGLLGPNGAGKSTAVNMMTTLSRPDSGEIRLHGVDVVRHPSKVRKVVGCVAQQSGVDGGSTGRENLTLQGRLYGLKGTPLKLRVSELLERFDLENVADRVSGTYSGGMKRKLDLAMGLIHRPRILFLDEPTTGLDPQARASLWDAIYRLSASEGLTVLLTTHYLEEADQLCDRLAIVDRGKVVVEGASGVLKGELQGDIVQIELDESASNYDKAKEILQVVQGVHEIVPEEQSLYVRTDNGAKAMPAVMGALEAAGLKVVTATISRPSLGDVYLRHTGRTFHKAQKEGA